GVQRVAVFFSRVGWGEWPGPNTTFSGSHDWLLSALLDLRRLVTPYLSSLGSTDSEGSHDAAARKTETPIRRQQFRSRTTARPTSGDSTASNLRAHTVDENAGEEDLRGGGR